MRKTPTYCGRPLALAAALRYAKKPHLYGVWGFFGLRTGWADQSATRSLLVNGLFAEVNELAISLAAARRSNPGLRLKLNTVVNRLNHGEDLSSLIRRFDPDKWKVLRMLPVVNQELAGSDQQFTAFISRHCSLGNILCAEDDQDMRESYLMVDPHGRFFQNSPLIAGQGYAYSQPILGVGVEAAFSEMTFDATRFSARYFLAGTGECA